MTPCFENPAITTNINQDPAKQHQTQPDLREHSREVSENQNRRAQLPDKTGCNWKTGLSMSHHQKSKEGRR